MSNVADKLIARIECMAVELEAIRIERGQRVDVGHTEAEYQEKVDAEMYLRDNIIELERLLKKGELKHQADVDENSKLKNYISDLEFQLLNKSNSHIHSVLVSGTKDGTRVVKTFRDAAMEIVEHNGGGKIEQINELQRVTGQIWSDAEATIELVYRESGRDKNGHLVGIPVK